MNGRKVLGICLMALGFLALITPLTPGSWLLFIGAEMVGIEILFAKKLAYRLGLRKKAETPV